MTEAGEPRLLIDPAALERLARSRGALFLVGGYDGAGNYGDVMQLAAGVSLVERLGESAVAVTVVEDVHADGHAELLRHAPELASSPACYVTTGAAATDRLVPLVLPAGLAFSALYLNGGGYLNADWGPRKLATVRALDAVVAAAGMAPMTIVSSGVQADLHWLRGLPEDDLELLRRVEILGVRDSTSLRSLAAVGIPAGFSGDDIVAMVAGRAARGPDPGERLRVNLHLQDGAWVTADPPRLRGFILDVISALEGELGGTAEIVPVVAYEDRRIDERALLAELFEDPGMRSRTVHDAVGLRPDELGAGLGALARARLTISCSYHVAMTSLLLGVPAALIADSAYYVQKASGLREQFALPEALTLDPSQDPAETARRLAGTLSGDAGSALDRGLKAHAAQALRRRRATEHELLGHLSIAFAGALSRQLDLLDEDAPGHDLRVVQLTARLATLRADHQALLVGSRRLRSALADERRANELALHEQRADELALRGAQIDELDRMLDAVRRSRSWRLTAPLRRARQRLGR